MLITSFNHKRLTPSNSADTAPLYPVVELDKDYALEKQDPLHRWAPELNGALAEYKLNGSTMPFFDWASKFHPKIRQVKYLTESEREPYKVDFSDPHNPVNKTKKDYSPKPGEKKSMLIFVMTENGDFYMHQKNSEDMMPYGFNHSSFFAGEPVAGMGMLHFNHQGKLVAIDNYSGHYKPKTEQVLNVMDSLMRKGVDLSKLSYEHRISPNAKDKNIYNNAQAWFDCNNASNRNTLTHR